MSIVGDTIDYGPFGFLDRYDPAHICNTSDEGGRYTYEKQPEICKWNLFKLAEMLKPSMELSDAQSILEEVYDSEFQKLYFEKMSKKLGLVKRLDASVDGVYSDRQIIETFLEAMAKTGGDFTNSFRALSGCSLPGMDNFEATFKTLRTTLLANCCTLCELIKANSADNQQVQVLLMIMQTNPGILARLGHDGDKIQAMIERFRRSEELKVTCNFSTSKTKANQS